jgi:hypothetical protein
MDSMGGNKQLSEYFVLRVDANMSQNFQTFHFHVRVLQSLAKLIEEELDSQ